MINSRADFSCGEIFCWLRSLEKSEKSRNKIQIASKQLSRERDVAEPGERSTFHLNSSNASARDRHELLCICHKSFWIIAKIIALVEFSESERPKNAESEIITSTCNNNNRNHSPTNRQNFSLFISLFVVVCYTNSEATVRAARRKQFDFLEGTKSQSRLISDRDEVKSKKKKVGKKLFRWEENLCWSRDAVPKLLATRLIKFLKIFWSPLIVIPDS